jgi:prepilin-type processing-associated H-X9-DG protein
LADGEAPAAVDYFDKLAQVANGIVFVASTVSVDDVRDGTTNTLAAGEKGLAPEHYASGLDLADNECMYIGENEDISRWTGPNEYPPYQDTPGLSLRQRFGSPHTTGFNAVFCDGAVRSISYEIDRDAYASIGNRSDGFTISPDAL